MAKSVAHAALDAAFAHIADRANRLALCQGAPASYSEAALTLAAGGTQLGSLPMVTGLGNGDYQTAAGDISGRKLIIARQDGVPVTDTGNADHVALIDTDTQTLLLVTNLAASVSVTAGSSIAIESFADEIGDPS
ncbi:MAG: hypothetical protein MRY63_06500 [Neomegalonema sp.]|nr:hypothetical protein [Neomegalonema sp.]